MLIFQIPDRLLNDRVDVLAGPGFENVLEKREIGFFRSQNAGPETHALMELLDGRAKVLIGLIASGAFAVVGRQQDLDDWVCFVAIGNTAIHAIHHIGRPIGQIGACSHKSDDLFDSSKHIGGDRGGLFARLGAGKQGLDGLADPIGRLQALSGTDGVVEIAGQGSG